MKVLPHVVSTLAASAAVSQDPTVGPSAGKAGRADLGAHTPLPAPSLKMDDSLMPRGKISLPQNEGDTGGQASASTDNTGKIMGCTIGAVAAIGVGGVGGYFGGKAVDESLFTGTLGRKVGAVGGAIIPPVVVAVACVATGGISLTDPVPATPEPSDLPTGNSTGTNATDTTEHGAR